VEEAFSYIAKNRANTDLYQPLLERTPQDSLKWPGVVLYCYLTHAQPQGSHLPTIRVHPGTVR